MTKLIYKFTDEPYGVILFAARFGEKWGDIPGDECLFIHEKDFATVFDVFASKFPLTDVETGETWNYDRTGMNWIHKDCCREIIQQLRCLKPIDPLHAEFIMLLCKWMSERLEWADEIMIEHTI